MSTDAFAVIEQRFRERYERCSCLRPKTPLPLTDYSYAAIILGEDSIFVFVCTKCKGTILLGGNSDLIKMAVEGTLQSAVEEAMSSFSTSWSYPYNA